MKHPFPALHVATVKELVDHRCEMDEMLCKAAPCMVKVRTGDGVNIDAILKGPCYPQGFYVVQTADELVWFVYRDQITL